MTLFLRTRFGTLLILLVSAIAVTQETESEDGVPSVPEWVQNLPSSQGAEEKDPREELPDWIELEPQRELSRQEEAERAVMLNMALSGRREDQLFALQEVERLVGSGSWDASTPYAQEVIGSLVLGAYRRQVRPEGSTPDATLRLRGTRLLSQLGGRRSELLIRDVLRYEQDSAVRAAAVEALGQMRVELDQELRDLLILSIRRELSQIPDERFVSALFGTIYVADSVRTIDDPALFRALFDVVESVGSRSLREEGFRLLEYLADR